MLRWGSGIKSFLTEYCTWDNRLTTNKACLADSTASSHIQSELISLWPYRPESFYWHIKGKSQYFDNQHKNQCFWQLWKYSKNTATISNATEIYNWNSRLKLCQYLPTLLTGPGHKISAFHYYANPLTISFDWSTQEAAHLQNKHEIKETNEILIPIKRS